jgi:hypothetical protein
MEDSAFSSMDQLEAFDWKLKKEEEKKLGHRRKSSTREHEEMIEEIAQLKRKREEREHEKQFWETEREKLAREKERSHYSELSRREDEFHMKQAKIRTQKRLSENRAKPIDYLYATVTSLNLPLDTIIPSPAQVIVPLDKDGLSELIEDIPLFVELDDKNKAYWESLYQIINRKLSTITNTSTEFEDEGIVHSAVIGDIEKEFENKTYQELVELENQIKQSIESGAAIDEEYWQFLLKRLSVQKTHAQVSEIHENMVDKRLSELVSKGKKTS